MKGTRCVGAGIGTHEVVAGHAVSGRAGAAGGEVGVSGLTRIVGALKNLSDYRIINSLALFFANPIFQI